MLLHSTADSKDLKKKSDNSKKCLHVKCKKCLKSIKAKPFESERVYMCKESGIKYLPETHLKILSK